MTERAARPAPPRRTRDPLPASIAAAALLGLVVGLCFPSLHVAVEPAQLWAGIVAYPDDNPYGLYQRRLWTVLHQLLAALLALGVPERALSFALSGAAGALAFAAAGAVAAALGASAPQAAFAATLLWMLNPAAWGFGYPILIAGHPHTYGMLGLAWIVLAWGVLGAGRFAWGGFLLGCAPAVHPSLGAWAAVVTAICVASDWRRIGAARAALLRGGALGAALAGASLAWHLAQQTPGPAVDPAEVERVFDAYLAFWDSHRAPFVPSAWQAAAIVASTALTCALLVRGPQAPGPTLLLRAVVACTALGMGFAVLADRAPGAIHDAVLALMPSRLVNVSMFALVPSLIGALALRWDAPVARLACYAVGALTAWTPRLPQLEWALFGAVALATVLLWLRTPAAAPRATRWDFAIASGVALGIAAAVLPGLAKQPVRAARMYDFRSDAAFAAASRGEGLLAVAPPIAMAQLRTRRPLLLDPNAIDMLPYAPAGGPLLARIVTDVYGKDFFAVPRSARRLTAVDPRIARPVWEARTADAWRALGARYGFRDVLAPADWRIDLPLVARSERLALYALGPSGSQ
ncbi:MAG: hypothetical protein DCC71_13835 [Proteobacteria bacterium]|nr:MAG: hypothetical protein DCC71_13835 [Pseudomonadota bacterium]